MHRNKLMPENILHISDDFDGFEFFFLAIAKLIVK